jgi:hypothetical protein
VTPRRLAALVLALTLAGCGLTGCGDEPREEPTSYLLTDLEGGTAAPEDFRPDGDDATPTQDPDDQQADDATEAPTGDELVQRIGAAAGAFDSVRVERGTGTPPADIEAIVAYGTSDDFEATVYVGPATPAFVVRRLDGALFVGTEDVEPQRVEPADVEPGAGGNLPSLFAWSPLLDLRAALEGATDLAVSSPDDADAEVVSSYRFTLDLEALPQPSVVVPDAEDGDAEVVLSLDERDLPVSLRFDYVGALGETTVVLEYSDWGAPLDLEAPASA